jgi:hypothetical protein
MKLTRQFHRESATQPAPKLPSALRESSINLHLVRWNSPEQKSHVYNLISGVHEGRD